VTKHCGTLRNWLLSEAAGPLPAQMRDFLKKEVKGIDLISVVMAVRTAFWVTLDLGLACYTPAACSPTSRVAVRVHRALSKPYRRRVPIVQRQTWCDDFDSETTVLQLLKNKTAVRQSEGSIKCSVSKVASRVSTL
jgi:hypothetical protein